ncbi:hypothetical protein MPSEU_000228100 [Mayamaea pseudoterrestris]|nr:hypothetical protein MPSEU_000228100 [Mayamaea pseudoterrestris]
MSTAVFLRRNISRRILARSAAPGASFSTTATPSCSLNSSRTFAPSAAFSVCPSSWPASTKRLYSCSSIQFAQEDYPPHILFPMPALSPTMDSGSISQWLVQEGDSFGAGTALCSIDTDKASVDFEAQDDGILAKILLQAGSDESVAVGTPICVVVEEEGDVAAFANYVADSPAASKDAAAAAAVESKEEIKEDSTSSVASPVTSMSGGGSILLPSARHLAESKGLDATVLSGSGKGGRVTKGDVMQALVDGSMPALRKEEPAKAPSSTNDQAAAPTTATTNAVPPAPAATTRAHVPLTLQDLVAETIHTTGSYEDVANNKMRKIIASRLTDSKRNVPHFYTAMPVQLDQIMKLRKQLVNEFDVKISINDFVIKCCAMALRDVPRVNATIQNTDGAIHVSETVDISVAVATPTGLITPIVFGTDQLGLAEITNKVKDLAGRAREGKLAPAEYQGGTFSISNLGMFGIDEFSAVINPPQAAILAVGGGSRRVVPTPYVDGAVDQKSPVIQTIMTARLSADRRAVDEPTAALFLSAFRQYMNQPQLLML